LLPLQQVLNYFNLIEIASLTKTWLHA